MIIDLCYQPNDCREKSNQQWWWYELDIGICMRNLIRYWYDIYSHLNFEVEQFEVSCKKSFEGFSTKL